MEEIIMPKWKMIGRYANNMEVIVGGNNEATCMCKLIGLTDKHGELTWYSGYCDEDYECGEYIGRNNFIYN